MTYDATETEDSNWGAFRLIGLLVLAAAFVGFVYLAYVQGVRNASVGTAPVIKSADGPYKIAPKDPGGRTFADTDKMVYDRVAGETTDVSGAVAQAEAETPADIGGPETFDTAALDLDKQPLVTGPTPVPQRRPDGITAAIAASEIAGDAAPAAGRESLDVASISPTIDLPTGDSNAPSIVSGSGVTGAATSGDFVLQLAAFRDRPSAEQAWVNVQRKHGDLLVGLSPDYEVAEVPGKGTYHRLRIGPFPSKAAAQEVCSALEARKQGCLLKKS